MLKAILMSQADPSRLCSGKQELYQLKLSVTTLFQLSLYELAELSVKRHAMEGEVRCRSASFSDRTSVQCGTLCSRKGVSMKIASC